MTTETQPARMGDADELALRVACMSQLREVESQYPDTGKAIREYLTFVVNERMRLHEEARARELSAHGGDGGGVLPEGHPQAPMPPGWLTLAVPCGDGRHFVHGPEISIEACRAALATQQPASGEVASTGDAAVDNALAKLTNGYEGEAKQRWAVGYAQLIATAYYKKHPPTSASDAEVEDEPQHARSVEQAIARLTDAVHDGAVKHAHFREVNGMDVDYHRCIGAGLFSAANKGLFSLTPPSTTPAQAAHGGSGEVTTTYNGEPK